MCAPIDPRQVVNEVFEEQTLVLGGLAKRYRIDEDLVWWVIQHLDTIRTRVLGRLDREDPHGAKDEDVRPHPAIAQFLERIRGGEA